MNIVPNTCCQRSFRGRFRRGLSLLEILVAFALVSSFALAIIHMLRSSGRQTEVFSAEHFTAMFLSQKMLEDINHRISENPHYFTELIHMASGDRKSVVNGLHPLFKTLENTRNFHHLDAAEDGPITPESGPIFQQLRPFEAQVESRFVIDPVTNHPYGNLLELVIKVFWKDQFSNDQSYTITQMLYGINEDHFRDEALAALPAFSDEQIGKALWKGIASSTMPSPPTLSSFQTANHGDAELVRSLGCLLHLVQTTLDTTESLNPQIDEAIRNRNTAMSGSTPQIKSQGPIYQEKVATLFEQKAGLIFTLLRRFDPTVAALTGRTYSETALGTLMYQQRRALREAAIHGLGLPTRINLNLLAAEDALTRLLEAPFRPLVSPRRINPAIRHLLDIRKLRILLESFIGDAQASLRSHQELLTNLRAQYDGKEPAFIQFLDSEILITRSIDDLRAHYGETNGLTSAIKKIGSLPLFFENLERALRTGGTL